jgi:hypothetical protein
MLSWKRIFLKAAGFGAGFAGILVLSFGFIRWYQNPPVPHPGWNKSAITAEWIKAAPEKGTIKFWYAVTNATAEDYRLDEGTGRFFLRIAKSNVLSPQGKLGVPIFIPSQHVVRLEFFVEMQGYPELLDTPEDGLSKILSDKTPQLDGFEIFDDAKHYEIVLPAGWKEQSQH